MIKCPNCGKNNSNDNKYCGECGNPLPSPKNYCPKCDVTFNNEKFCTQCGTQLVNENEYLKEIERLKQKKRINDELVNRNIGEQILLQFCKDNNINVSSEEEFSDYASTLYDNEINEIFHSLEQFNQQKIKLYNKYKHLRKESLLLLCKHDSIEFTTTHDVVYYFTCRYSEDQILNIIQIEKDNLK